MVDGWATVPTGAPRPTLSNAAGYDDEGTDEQPENPIITMAATAPHATGCAIIRSIWNHLSRDLDSAPLSDNAVELTSAASGSIRMQFARFFENALNTENRGKRCVLHPANGI